MAFRAFRRAESVAGGQTPGSASQPVILQWFVTIKLPDTLDRPLVADNNTTGGGNRDRVPSQSLGGLVMFDTMPLGEMLTWSRIPGRARRVCHDQRGRAIHGRLAEYNTLRNWGMPGKIRIHRNPVDNYRLFKKSDLTELLRQIEQSGQHPTGWERSEFEFKKSDLTELLRQIEQSGQHPTGWERSEFEGANHGRRKRFIW